MMALFSPSEGRRAGGSGVFETVRDQLLLDVEEMNPLIAAYERVLRSGTDAQKQGLTGWKDATAIAQLPVDVGRAPVLPALDRYSGVGYQYLDVATLTVSERAYLEANVFIFSHLFGPLRGMDLIPETKLKQRTTFAGVSLARYWRERAQGVLDELIGEAPVLDLRAGVYKGYYKPKGPVITCTFLKEGKVVNHWSKAYRGAVLRHMAQLQPVQVEGVVAMQIPGIAVTEVQRGEKGSVHINYAIK